MEWIIIKTFQKMKESSICVKLDLIPEKKSYSDVLSGLFFVLIENGVFMALSWRVNQPLIIVKYNYKNKGGLRYAVW